MRYTLTSYLTGAVAARTGDEMAGPALMLAGFAIAGSATEASSLLAAVTVAAAVGGPLLGVLLDRAARPGRLLAGTIALHAAGLALVLLSLGRLPLAAVVPLAVVTGLFGPALSGGWTAQLHRVVAGDALPRANALDAMTFHAASLTGPALAGGLAELLGAPTAVVVSVVLMGVAFPAAWRLPVRPGAGRAPTKPAVAGPEPDAHTPSAASVLRQLTAGTRFIVRARSLARATLVTVISCTAQGILIACAPLLGERVLGGAGHGAMLLSCLAVSALAAGALLARFPRALAPDTLLWAGALLQAVALLLAASGRPALLVAAVLLTGVGDGPQLTALFAIRHRESPDHLRAQVFTTGASLKITGFALGAAAAGPLATWSLPAALLTAATVHLLAVLAFFTIRPSRPGVSAASTRPSP